MKDRRYDILLLMTMLALTAIGFLLVTSSSYVMAGETLGDKYFYVKRHLVYVAIACTAFTLTQFIPLKTWRKLALPLFVLSILMLILVLASPFARYAGGAYRWLQFGPIRFQPSELARFTLILFLANLVSNKGEKMQTISGGLMTPLIFLGMVCVLVLAEPDFGTTVSLGMTGFVLIYLGGARLKHLGLCSLLALPLVAYALMGSAYRRDRLLTFMNPWDDPMNKGFQIIQSFVAIRSGGLFGQGLGDGVQKFFYLPEAHTDFTFSILAEEMGFFGIALVIILFLLLMFRGLKIVCQCENRYASLVAAGVVFTIAIQAFTNMAVVMGLLPTKGLVLPLISFGGSSLIATYVCLGILHRISVEGKGVSA